MLNGNVWARQNMNYIQHNVWLFSWSVQHDTLIVYSELFFNLCLIFGMPWFFSEKQAAEKGF